MITIDHDKGELRNIALLEVGYQVAPDGEAVTTEHAAKYLRAANAPSRSAQQLDAPSSLKTLAADRPEAADMLLGLFWADGPPDHLADGAGGTLLHAPYCRLGHPTDPFRLDLKNTSGTVIGVIRRARFWGQQLRGDVVLLDHPPIDDWPYVRAAILTMAAERPTEFGLSICSTGTICSTCPSDGGLAVAIDLVSRPAANRNGLLGLPTNGLASHPQPAVREIGRRRTYWPEVVYEALIESWITGEPV